MMKSYHSLDEAIREIFGAGVSAERRHAVSGGDINEAYLVQLSDGKAVFLKQNSRSNRAFFGAEQNGLAAIRSTGTISAPQVLAAGTDESAGRSFLMMEYLRPSERRPDFWEAFGRELAGLHRADASEFVSGGRYGFYEDNFIGAGRQINAGKDRWLDFFRECRLQVQFERARPYFRPEDLRKIRSLMDHLEDFLTEPEHPSLLHGDLWGGNFVTGPDGRAWLIDPAVYVGHAEADLAMTELFGGFAPAFYRAYRENMPDMYGYEDRRDLYNLYHLLNHLNLFGPAYYSSVMRTVKRYAGK